MCGRLQLMVTIVFTSEKSLSAGSYLKKLGYLFQGYLNKLSYENLLLMLLEHGSCFLTIFTTATLAEALNDVKLRVSIESSDASPHPD